MTKAKSPQTIIRPHKGGRTIRIVGYITPEIAAKLETLKEAHNLSNGDFLTLAIKQFEIMVSRLIDGETNGDDQDTNSVP